MMCIRDTLRLSRYYFLFYLFFFCFSSNRWLFRDSSFKKKIKKKKKKKPVLLHIALPIGPHRFYFKYYKKKKKKKKKKIRFFPFWIFLKRCVHERHINLSSFSFFFCYDIYIRGVHAFQCPPFIHLCIYVLESREAITFTKKKKSLKISFPYSTATKNRRNCEELPIEFTPLFCAQ